MSDKSAYELARENYWEVQSKFRELGRAEIARLIPAPYVAALFDFNDADPPRLSLDCLITADGEKVYGEEDLDESVEVGVENLFGAIDGIASDMEYAHWDEASGVLFRTDDGMNFIIERSTS